MALGGIAMMNGYGEHSLAMGGEYASMGIIAALLGRDLSGHGAHLDVSIHECVAGTTEGAFWNWEYNGVNPERKTGRHAGTVDEWQMASDEGGYVVVFGGGVPRSRNSLRDLLAWMDEHDAAGDLHAPRYEVLLTMSPLEAGELHAEFGAAVMAFLRSRPVDEVYRRGQAIDMAWAPVRAPEDNLDDPTGRTASSSWRARCPASTARSATLARATSSRARRSRCAVARRSSVSTRPRCLRANSGSMRPMWPPSRASRQTKLRDHRR